MKSLALDNFGDLLIKNNELQMVDGDELLRQKVKEVINTNKGEWFADWEQGIEFSSIIGKGVTEDAVMLEIEDGLRQVDESFYITDFTMEKVERTLRVKFTASNETANTEITVITEF